MKFNSWLNTIDGLCEIEKRCQHQRATRNATSHLGPGERAEVMAALIIESVARDPADVSEDPERPLAPSRRTLDRVEFQVLAMEMCSGHCPHRVNKIFDGLRMGGRNGDVFGPSCSDGRHTEIALSVATRFFAETPHPETAAEAARMRAARRGEDKQNRWDDVMARVLLRHGWRRSRGHRKIPQVGLHGKKTHCTGKHADGLI
jgi:hypothetical protein